MCVCVSVSVCERERDFRYGVMDEHHKQPKHKQS